MPLKSWELRPLQGRSAASFLPLSPGATQPLRAPFAAQVGMGSDLVNASLYKSTLYLLDDIYHKMHLLGTAERVQVRRSLWGGRERAAGRK